MSDRKDSRIRRFIDWGKVTANPSAREFIGPAMQGNPANLKALVSRLSKEEIAIFTLEMYRARVPLAPYRYFLREAWVWSWNWLIRVVGNYPTVFEMFRYANFPIPAKLGPTVKAYRGTNGISAYQSATGMSWSLNRDIACHHAYVDPLGKSFGEPLVIEAEIPRKLILMYTSWGAFFNEITVVPVASDPAIECRVSSPTDNWLEGHQRYCSVVDRAKLLLKEQDEASDPLEQKRLYAAVAALMEDQ